MTEDVRVVSADADLEEVATLMVEDRVNPVPVVEGGRLVGIISHTDLVQHLEEAREPVDDEEAAA
jgi:CBS domain-containing protein